MSDYKGFDFIMQLQGTGGSINELTGWYQKAVFTNGGTAQRWQYENRWTPQNPDRNAKYLRVTPSSYPGSEETSDYWTFNSSFLRVKNIQIGYNLPKNFLLKYKIQGCRIYVNGENLASFDNYYQGWDPEMDNGGENGSFYPIIATYTAGISIKF